MTNRDLKTCEALLIKKTPLGESDTTAVFFTKEFGKIRAVAKNAASSRKRFGGRLQPFSHLRIELSTTRSGKKIVQSAETLKSFENVAKDMRIFIKASCLLEFIDAGLPEEEAPDGNIFTEALKALLSMSRGRGFPAMLAFQTASLESFGYGIDISQCGGCGRENFPRGILVFPTGAVLCGKCARNSDEKPARKIHRAEAAKNFSAALENINCLNAFFQYQTGRVLQSSKVLENMCE